ncbi:MAG: hypothetical protein AVDCRST_MAG56-7308 [uncultured Cytophagales bacterium]|uniref:Uncharacterized protein n=1 Tax=uncultured Cytophagales bacterium TaxID=158755 RepID=A0A6J4LEE4_9SPHI|nr:MAG: hypothetical protein AVDCRST_MAG56-7308 [uncultured Cytophagales bacterium]
MVKTGNGLWRPLAFILWHFPKMALPAGKLTASAQWPSVLRNPLLSFPGTRPAGSASFLPIVLFSEIIGHSRRLQNRSGAVLLRKWQKVMLFLSPDFLIFGNTF